MRIKLVGAAMAALLLMACGAQIVRQPLYPEEQSYLDDAMRQPLQFDVPASENNAAWGRAQDYLAKFSQLKIQTSTSDLLDTYSPSERGQIGYKINRIPGHVSTQFSVDCVAADASDAHLANRNAHLLAYYIALGRPVPMRLATWCPATFQMAYGSVCEEEDQIAAHQRGGISVTQN